MEYYYVEGYAFSTKEEYNLALREQKNIRALNDKIDYTDVNNVLAVYKKLVERKLLVTPVGITYLYELRKLLTEQLGVAATDIPMIKVEPRKSNVSDKAKYSNEQLVKIIGLREDTIRTQKVVITGLIIVVLAMFAMALFLPNTGYLTYKKSVENKYSNWEENLKEREQKVLEKEEELNIDNDNN